MMYTRLHLIGVSAGDATLVEHVDGDRVYYILIDGGLNRRITVEYLLTNDVRRLDLVVASHLDYDHLGGLVDVFKEPRISIGECWIFDITILKTFLETGVIPAKQITEPKYFLRLLTAWDILRVSEDRGIPCKQVAAGHIARFGGLVFEVLYPCREYLDYLYNPLTLKVMLEKSAIPIEWKIGKHRHAPSDIREAGRRRPHRRLRFPKDDLIDTWQAEVRQEYERARADDEELLGKLGTYWPQDEKPRSCWRREAESDEPRPSPRQVCNDSTILNDFSTVFRMSAVGREGFKSVLFTGDLENWTPLILSDGFRLRSDILKLPHHGSNGVGWSPDLAFKFSVSQMTRKYNQVPFPLEHFFPTCFCLRVFDPDKYNGDVGDILDLVSPEVALVFPFPRFGLPDRGVVEELKQRGVRVVANRPDGSNLASTRTEPEDRVVEIE